MPALLSRVTTIIKDDGLIGLLRRAAGRIKRLARDKWNRCFNNYNFIFQYDPASPRLPVPPSFVVMRFDRVDAIPTDIYEKLVAVFGESPIATNCRFIEKKSAVFWIALLEGEPVCIRLSRKGKHIPFWFLPLSPNDVILMRGNTAEGHRGKSLSPTQMQIILTTELVEGAIGYSDCSVTNISSIRSLTKAGFKNIGKMKPIHEPF